MTTGTAIFASTALVLCAGLIAVIIVNRLRKRHVAEFTAYRNRIREDMDRVEDKVRR